MIGLGLVHDTMLVGMYYVDSIAIFPNMLRMAEEKYGSIGTMMVSLRHWINQPITALPLNILLGFLLLAAETILSDIPPNPVTYFVNSDNIVSINMQPLLE